MSAFGPKRTSLAAPHMSAFGGNADISKACRYVRFTVAARLAAGGNSNSFPKSDLPHQETLLSTSRASIGPVRPRAERALISVKAGVLSDINMPGMTGLELLPKAKAARPDVPVIMITAYGD